MEHSEFRIGMEFEMGDARWHCTDIGTRTIAAIKLEAPDPSWFNGPPYAVAEYCLDENDMDGCGSADGERETD